MSVEINLVPDIKNEMIKTLKLRNFIFFICIIVSAASAGVALFFATIVGGQQLALNGKTSVLESMSEKINSYTGLSDFITVRDQVGVISSIANNKTVASRVFNLVSSFIPAPPDQLTISKLSLTFTEDVANLALEGQVNAGTDPGIDYRVLDALKKSVEYIYYDYGHYVDRDNNIIPDYCIIDSDDNGNYFADLNGHTYAYWTISAEGCSQNTSSLDDSSEEDSTSLEDIAQFGYATEMYNDLPVVRIWRNPTAVINTWYERGFITLDGAINNIEHFESSCIRYLGEETTNPNNGLKNIRWTANADSCPTISTVTGNQITTNNSFNGRNATEDLVLVFEIVIPIKRDVFDFNNSNLLIHMPNRRNVTDSYRQLQKIFSEKAKKCSDDDTVCQNDKVNTGEQ